MMFFAFALAGTPQQIAVAEWRREPVSELVTLGPAEDPKAWIRALGRIRSPAARSVLTAYREGPEAAQATFALGLTPAAVAGLRILSETEPTGREGDVRWMALEGLGRQGAAQDVARLERALAEGWPYDEAAARGLLRLHRAGVDVRAAVPRLERTWSDPRTEVAAAQTLARVGVPGSHDVPWQTAMTSPARAALFKAAKGDGRDPEAIAWGLRDHPLVRIEALDAIARSKDPGAAAAVREHLWSTDPSIQLAAIGAASALQLTDDLQRRLEDPGALGATATAAIHRALHRDPGLDEGPLLAAVSAELQEDPAVLEGLLQSEIPMVRTSAVMRLLELDPPVADVLKLLAHPDPAVRQAAIEHLEEPDAATVEELLLSLRVENDQDVLAAGLELLRSWRAARKSTVPVSRFLTSTLKRGMSSRSVHLRQTAQGLAGELGLDLVPPPPATAIRELILPDGTITTTTGDLPDLAYVQQLERAVVNTSRGRFVIALDPQTAPLAVHNFASLAQAGFYTELRWHRVVPGFVAQAGCPRGDGWGGPGWTIVDEVSPKPFVDGAVGMARSARDTGGSQFFVMTGPARFLDGDYTAFGTVIEGLEVVRRLTQDDVIHTIDIERSDAP